MEYVLASHTHTHTHTHTHVTHPLILLREKPAAISSKQPQEMKPPVTAREPDCPASEMIRVLTKSPTGDHFLRARTTQNVLIPDPQRLMGGKKHLLF